MTAHVQTTSWPIGSAMAAPLLRAGSVLVRTMGPGLQAVQYAQMVSVMSRLPDSCLSQAGLRRDAIPEHARQTIYGDVPAGSRSRG